ncbi:MAG TPA: galactose-1-phosphate uridylyltransferase [Acidimicrobiales bacterium]|nr:galactose-1-phosphate uridylyltransferase [Acidimicrobiales bacterium]
MRVARTALADGRELVYYDLDGAPERTGTDARALEPRPPASQLRYDPFLDAWVIVAAYRQERTYFPAPDDCPLCPSRPGHPSEIPAADYGVVVLENRFPALSGPGPSRAELAGPATPLVSRPGAGRCEVVCFSPDHDASLVDLGEEQLGLVLAVWTDRTRLLGELPAVEQVFCFENRGPEIGVTLQHPHGQIYAYPFVTPRTTRVLASVDAYARRTGRNLFDDVLEAERADRARVVAENDTWTAFVPHAARWPYEVHVYPRRRVPDLVALDPGERDGFVSIYLDLLARFDRLFGARTPYISAWHQAPTRTGRASFALHLELFTTRRSADKLKYLAASESGMDAFANDVLPEHAAERLRELGPGPGGVAGLGGGKAER